MVNVVLADAVERVYSEDGLQVIPVGCFVLRGDDVAVVSELDSLDVDLECRAKPLSSITH